MPWRKLAISAAAGIIAAAVAVALIVPPLQEGKRRGAARDAREQAALIASIEARLRRDQRVHRASVDASGPAALVDALERSITADTRARARARTLDGPILGTNCEPAGKSVVIRPGTRVYKCTAMSTGYRPGQAGVSFATGYPFVATIDFREHTLAWCKTNPRPGEKTRGKGIAHVRVSPECAGTLAKLL